jgi:hypothetical protein
VPLAHAAGVGRVGKGGVGEPAVSLRARPAEQEYAADAGVVQGLEVRVGVLGCDEVVRPVGDCGDAGVERLECAPERAGVDVLGSVVGREAGDHGGEVARQGGLAGAAADRALPDVAVGVDQAGQDEASGRVDRARVGSVGCEAGADRGDPTAAYEQVRCGEVSRGRVERGEMAAGDEQVAVGHDVAGGTLSVSPSCS